MRASLEHPEVQVVAVNDPFIDLEYMVIDIKSHIVLVLISRNKFWSHDIKQVHILGFDKSCGIGKIPNCFAVIVIIISWISLFKFLPSHNKMSSWNKLIQSYVFCEANISEVRQREETYR